MDPFAFVKIPLAYPQPQINSNKVIKIFDFFISLTPWVFRNLGKYNPFKGKPDFVFHIKKFDDIINSKVLMQSFN